MPIKELEDLFATIADPTDRAAIDAILERNPNARTLAVEQRNLYKAFVEGDQTEINRMDQLQREAQAREAANRRNNPDPAANTGHNPTGWTLDQMNAEFEKRFKAQGDEFKKTIEEISRKTAETVADERGPRLLEQTIGTADNIYSIKSGHKDEFGEALDMTKFNEFVTANRARYPTLTEAHDAFVQEKRVAKQIADGITAGVAAAQPNEVPGTTLAKSDSMAARFVAKNAAMAGTARGDGLDAATAAFRSLRAGRQN